MPCACTQARSARGAEAVRQAPTSAARSRQRPRKAASRLGMGDVEPALAGEQELAPDRGHGIEKLDLRAGSEQDIGGHQAGGTAADDGDAENGADMRRVWGLAAGQPAGQQAGESDDSDSRRRHQNRRRHIARAVGSPGVDRAVGPYRERVPLPGGHSPDAREARRPADQYPHRIDMRAAGRIADLPEIVLEPRPQTLPSAFRKSVASLVLLRRRPQSAQRPPAMTFTARIDEG